MCEGYRTEFRENLITYMTITYTPAVLSQNSLIVAEESKKSPNGVVAVFFAGGRVPPCSQAYRRKLKWAVSTLLTRYDMVETGTCQMRNTNAYIFTSVFGKQRRDILSPERCLSYVLSLIHI